MPRARQAPESAPTAGAAPTPKPHRHSPRNTAASCTRSRVESRNAPQRPVDPASRAMIPSTRSENTNAVMKSVPQNRCPRGNSTSAPRLTPSVPTTVTVSGLTPARRSVRATGVNRRVVTPRA